jgi:hypothetical protein
MMKFEDLLEHLVTVNLPFNPKQKGSAAFKYFERYNRETPISVRESLERGVRRVDIRYDLNWGYISLTEPDKQPMNIAAEFNRCGVAGAEYLLIYRHPLTGTRIVTNVETANKKGLVDAMFKRARDKGSLD